MASRMEISETAVFFAMGTEAATPAAKVKTLGGWWDDSVRLALTGTPGTGKSAVGRVLARRGVLVVDLGRAALYTGCVTGIDRRRGSREVDVGKLNRVLKRQLKESTEPLIVFQGHLAHHLDVDGAVVLRCPPSVLARRLGKRRWAKRKVRENACAEAVGVIVTEAVEALGPRHVFEVNTSRGGAGFAARAVMDVAAGRGARYAAGSLDFLEEAPRWC